MNWIMHTASVVFITHTITMHSTGIAGPTIHIGAMDTLHGIIRIGHGDIVRHTGAGDGEAAGTTDPTIPGDTLLTLVDITEAITEVIMVGEDIPITAIMVTEDIMVGIITLHGIGIRTITNTIKEEQPEQMYIAESMEQEEPLLWLQMHQPEIKVRLTVLQQKPVRREEILLYQEPELQAAETQLLITSRLQEVQMF